MRVAAAALAVAEAAVVLFKPAEPWFCTATLVVSAAAINPSITGDGDCAVAVCDSTRLCVKLPVIFAASSCVVVVVRPGGVPADALTECVSTALVAHSTRECLGSVWIK